MREIKFRVWDKELKYMHVCGTSIHDSMIFLGHNCQCIYYNLQNGDGSSEKGSYILMQYTGLKDRNGKEIYEGDILPFTMHNGKVESYYIVFRDGEYEAINKDDTNFISIDLWKTSEVIGNIYDNPELLEED